MQFFILARFCIKDDVEITLSAAIFDGKGDNLFANLKDYNMFMFKFKYSF